MSPESVCLTIRSLSLITIDQCTCSTGKTTFLKFMLARLISAQQVVLLCDDSATHLFYRGGVYIRPTEPHGFMNLPTHAPHNPIWALIDVGYEDRGPPLTGSTGVWPIQASSPNPVRFKSWSKQDGATLLGMPPWSMMDLVEAYVSIPFYLSAVDPRHVA